MNWKFTVRFTRRPSVRSSSLIVGAGDRAGLNVEHLAAFEKWPGR